MHKYRMSLLAGVFGLTVSTHSLSVAPIGIPVADVVTQSAVATGADTINRTISLTSKSEIKAIEVQTKAIIAKMNAMILAQAKREEAMKYDPQLGAFSVDACIAYTDAALRKTASATSKANNQALMEREAEWKDGGRLDTSALPDSIASTGIVTNRLVQEKVGSLLSADNEPGKVDNKVVGDTLTQLIGSRSTIQPGDDVERAIAIKDLIINPMPLMYPEPNAKDLNETNLPTALYNTQIAVADAVWNKNLAFLVGEEDSEYALLAGEAFSPYMSKKWISDKTLESERVALNSANRLGSIQNVILFRILDAITDQNMLLAQLVANDLQRDGAAVREHNNALRRAAGQ